MSLRLAAGLLAGVATVLAVSPLRAQQLAEPLQPLRELTPQWHALTQVRIVTAPGQVIEQGTVVLKDGLITAVGADVQAPPGARTWALPGRTVYAGFIDAGSSLGLPAALKPAAPERPMWGPGSELPRPAADRSPPPPAPVARSLASGNNKLRAEQDVAQQLDWKADDARAARGLGFTSALVGPASGVFRGQGALVALGDGPDARGLVLAPRLTQHLAFEFDRGRAMAYPSSLMGAVALTRQTLLDARWQRQARDLPGQLRAAPNVSLEALGPVLDGRQLLVHHAADELDAGRLARLRDEFKLRVALHGTGHEYRQAARLKAANLPVIVPLAYPATPDLHNPDLADDVPLHLLQHWEQAPSNLARLDRAGVAFSITAAGLREPAREFWPRLRQAVRRGLAPQAALAGLTTAPAALLGQQDRLGRIAPGQLAHLVVARGDLFGDNEAEVELSFVDGRPYTTPAFDRPDLRGTWVVAGSGETLVVKGSRQAPRLERDGASCGLSAQGRQWVLRLTCSRAAGPAAPAASASAPAAMSATPAAPAGPVVVAALVTAPTGAQLVGTVQAQPGAPLQAWTAERRSGPERSPARPEAAVPEAAATYPAGAYGMAPPPQPAQLLVRNATVWTQGQAGTLKNADLLVRAGKVAAVGTGLPVPADAEVIDAQGGHVTPGLIDAHSHIAMSLGVNESAHSVTSEVRTADAIDPTDIAIYRQLAGGLTMSHVLHGSANTIGGQSSLLKLRWGSDAQGLLAEGFTPTIKFALGENVKRSNWGDSGRYPATRMGVEQVLRDAFAAAAEYRRDAADWRARPAGRPEPRRDLRLEALVEVLERRRLVHIHSYRADEILMFTRVARELGLEVAAFQHVLEGYKVADQMAAIGAGGSTFSDWWAYKMEVVDAIPANGALMQRAGVLVSFNSDDAELARRLNTEAAKAQKYGGLSDEQALALVTSNPARQLRMHTRTGSLEVGKDADFVLWNGHPLSTTSRAEQTWVDGRRYFSRADDLRLRQQAAAERERLTAAVLRAARDTPAAGGGGSAPPRPTLIAAADLGQPLAPLWSRELQTWVAEGRHHDAAWRGSYGDGSAWHECTEEAVR